MSDSSTTALPPAASSDAPHAEVGPAASVWAWVRVVGGALLFAVLLRAFAFDAYRIPSTSMEDTLLVGDFILVSKLHYGARLFGHRLPGFTEVARGNVVVFHYPPGLEEPLDRRAPYIKRVVGLPGDTVRIVDKEVRAGVETVPFPREGRLLWEVQAPEGATLDTLRSLSIDGQARRVARGIWLVEATTARAYQLRDLSDVEAVRPLVRPGGDGSAAFPASAHFSLDNYGPLTVPEAGATVRLDDAAVAAYRSAIERFEGHAVERVAGGYLLDGVPAETYTFSKDYFFVLGDNRDDSADSRTWGFVPRDHLIGKAVLVYYSWDVEAGAPRWGRFARGVE